MTHVGRVDGANRVLVEVVLLRQLVEERGLPWDEATRFRFVSEVAT